MPRTASASPKASAPALKLVGTKPRKGGRVENANVYLTGSGIADAVRATFKAGTRERIIQAAIDRALDRARARWVPTEDPDDRAHAVFCGSDLLPARELPEGQTATPRRYPACLMVEVLIKGRRRLYSPDAACELLGERASALAAQGVPVGYVGSVTGAIASRGRDGPADLVSARDQLGEEAFRNLTRQKTRQSRLTKEELRLTREASALLKGGR